MAAILFFAIFRACNQNPAWYTADSDSAGPNSVKTVVYYKLLKNALTIVK